MYKTGIEKHLIIVYKRVCLLKVEREDTAANFLTYDLKNNFNVCHKIMLSSRWKEES